MSRRLLVKSHFVGPYQPRLVELREEEKKKNKRPSLFLDDTQAAAFLPSSFGPSGRFYLANVTAAPAATSTTLLGPLVQRVESTTLNHWDKRRGNRKEKEKKKERQKPYSFFREL